MNHKFKINDLIDKLKSTPEYEPYKLNIGNSVDSFLRIRETLTRVGRLQKNKNTNKESLWQVCHIVQDEDSSNFYLVHFKHLYMLSGKDTSTTFVLQDFDQLNYIASLLHKWGLATTDETLGEVNTRCNISIIPFARKKEVLLRKKFYLKSEA